MNVELDPANVSIRVASQADLAAILALASACGLLEPGISEAVERFSVAAAKGRTVGVCGLEAYDNVGLLRTLGVEPQYRRQGLGQKLVETMLARGRAERLERVYLLTTSAQAYFARLGFEQASRATAPTAIQQSWEFKAGCPSSATLMVSLR